jgi:hypothetical protein
LMRVASPIPGVGWGEGVPGVGAGGAGGEGGSGAGDYYTQGMSLLCPLEDDMLPLEAANLKTKQVRGGGCGWARVVEQGGWEQVLDGTQVTGRLCARAIKGRWGGDVRVWRRGVYIHP